MKVDRNGCFLTLTVNVQSSRMLIHSSSVLDQTNVNSSIFNRHSTDVNMANHVTMNCNVLTNQKSEDKKVSISENLAPGYRERNITELEYIKIEI